MRRTLLRITIFAIMILAASAVFALDSVILKADPGTKTAYTGPVWSPVGRTLAVVSGTYTDDPNLLCSGCEGKCIVTLTQNGSAWKSRVLLKNADLPVWSPDGKQLAATQSGLVVADVATGKAKIVAASKAVVGQPVASDVYEPLSWSPTGKFLMYRIMKQETWEVRLKEMKTGKDTKVATDCEAWWLPDSKVLTSYSGGVDGPGKGWLKIIDPVAGKSRTIVTGYYLTKPYIQKDGRYVFVHIADGAPKGKGIYRIDLKTSIIAKMTALSCLQLHWSPDGKKFIFITKYSPKGDVPPKSTLYVGDTVSWAFGIAAKDASKVDDVWYQHAQWAPTSKSAAYVSELGDVKLLIPE